MQELKLEETLSVIGGSTTGANIAFGVGAAWASTVSSAAAGFVIGGPVGGAVGAGIGFFMSVAIGTGFILARSNSEE